MEEQSSYFYSFRNNSEVAFARLFVLDSFRLLDKVKIQEKILAFGVALY
jgi:hypothetical protein